MYIYAEFIEEQLITMLSDVARLSLGGRKYFDINVSRIEERTFRRQDISTTQDVKN